MRLAAAAVGCVLVLAGPACKEAPQRQVLVAATSLGAGDAVASEHLATATIPAAMASAGMIDATAQSSVIGRKLRVPLGKGDPVLSSLLEEPEPPRRAPTVAPGQRVISLEMRGLRWAKPGDRIDVLVSYNSGNTIATGVLARGLPLLDVSPEGGTASLAVSPADLPRLLQAAQKPLHAVLLGPDAAVAQAAPQVMTQEVVLARAWVAAAARKASPDPATKFLGTPVRKGAQALALDVEGADLVQPGDTVDILWTYDAGTGVATLLPEVKVLDLGPQRRPGRRVAFEVFPGEPEALVGAAQTGTLRVALVGQ